MNKVRVLSGVLVFLLGLGLPAVGHALQVTQTGGACTSVPLISPPGVNLVSTGAMEDTDLVVTVLSGGGFSSGFTVRVTNVVLGPSGTAPAGDIELTGIVPEGTFNNTGPGRGGETAFVDNTVTPNTFTVDVQANGLTTSGTPCFIHFLASGIIQGTGTHGLSNQSPPSQLSQGTVMLSKLENGNFRDTFSHVGRLWGSGPDAALSLRLGPGGGSFAKRGLGAGEWAYPLGVWGNVGYTSLENDFVSVALDSKSLHGTLGADVTVNDSLVVGFAAGYESDDIDTPFNGGNIESDAFTVVGYAAAFVNDEVTVDAAVGRSAVDNDQFRTTGGARVTSSFDSDRTFLGANVNYGRSFGDMRFTGTAGIVWAKDAADAFTESDGTAVASSDFIIGRAKLRGEFSALYGDWEPFISAAYNRSLTETDQVFAAGVADPGQDKTDVLLGLGARYFGSEGMSGLVEFTSVLGRDHVEQYSISAIIRAEF